MQCQESETWPFKVSPHEASGKQDAPVLRRPRAASKRATGPKTQNPRTIYPATRLLDRFVMRCWLFAGPAGQIAVRLLALRIVPMLDARCENPRRRDANGAKHQCRNQRGCEI